MTESLERILPVWKIMNSVFGRVKPMAQKIDALRYLAWHSALLGWAKDWLAQYLDLCDIVGNQITVQVVESSSGGITIKSPWMCDYHKWVSAMI